MVWVISSFFGFVSNICWKVGNDGFGLPLFEKIWAGQNGGQHKPMFLNFYFQKFVLPKYLFGTVPKNRFFLMGLSLLGGVWEGGMQLVLILVRPACMRWH